jgi:tartronate-semialdehyde synthase
MAVTVLEPAQVPGTFQQAFHLMRSGRPGLVLIDLLIDVHRRRSSSMSRSRAVAGLQTRGDASPDRPSVDLLDEAERPLTSPAAA